MASRNDQRDRGCSQRQGGVMVRGSVQWKEVLKKFILSIRMILVENKICEKAVDSVLFWRFLKSPRDGEAS